MLVAEDESRAWIPTAPATCSPAVESVAVYAHVDGSAEPSTQARIRTVVGLAPCTCMRTQMALPALYGASAFRSEPMNVSVSPTACAACTNVVPAVEKRTRPR
jgi:hypothetical protein